MTNVKSTNGRLDALRKREAALRNAILIEKVRQQKKDERDDARLHLIIGAALLHNAKKHTDFELMLRSVLASVTTFSDGETRLLKTKGWL